MPKEIERRFLIIELSQGFPFDTQRELIHQAYFDVADTSRQSLRVRLYDCSDVEITFKEGKGIVRDEESFEGLPLALGKKLFAVSSLKLEKMRHYCGGWEIDFFHAPLEGIVLAELELPSRDTPCLLPSWIGTGIEVTDSLTNLHLARLARLLRDSGECVLPYVFRRLERRIPKIVLVGGPGCGKSGVMEALRREFLDIQWVPEVATILIGQVGILPGGTIVQNRKFQLAVHNLQHIFEYTSEDSAIDDGKRALVFDRGKPDGAGYLENGVKEFENLTGNRLEDELREYDLVIFIGMPSQEVFERIKKNNPARKETYEEAILRAGKLQQIWQRHHNYLFVSDYPSWDEKADAVCTILRSFLASLQHGDRMCF